jgi:serine/threonine-protein kinase
MLARRQARSLFPSTLVGVVAALALSACKGEVIPPGGDPPLQLPGGPGPGGGGDGGPGDAGRPDAGGPDGGRPDAGPPDAGSPPPDGGTAGDRFPDSATIYEDVSGAPLDPSSAQIIAHLADAGWGTGAMQIDFSFDVLHADDSVQPRAFTPAAGYYSPDCDQVPVPVPPGGATEGSTSYACDTSRNDCHLLVYQGRRLYELYQANIAGGLASGSPFTTICAVVWDLDRDYWQPGTPYSRGDQCTSADAAGLPIAPLLVTGAELQAGVVPHALRFILPNPRMAGGVYVHPATHAGAPSGDALYPPYGSRFRLRSSFDLSQLPNAAARAVAVALQTYGMILADGGNVPLTMDRSVAAYLGSHDLALLQVSDFEMVAAPSGRIPLTYNCTRTPLTQ